MDDLGRPIAFRRTLVDLTGSVQAALMLSQAIYWQERVTHKDGWWYKSIEEWEEETGLSRRRLETARRKNKQYLLSKLRDIPARLYWKVDGVKLRSALERMLHRKWDPGWQPESDQAVENRESGLAENADGYGGNDETHYAENTIQLGGNEQTSLDDFAEPEGHFHPNINMNTENTSENSTEISSKNREEVEEEENEEEENRLLRRLIESCLIGMPEENPDVLTHYLSKSAERFGLERVREAVNESVLQNKRTLMGVWLILNNWSNNGQPHSSKPGKTGISGSQA